MFVKSYWLTGLLVLGAYSASAQTYWSKDANLNCGTYGEKGTSTPHQIANGGYVCYAYGTLPWYASGGNWLSSIRASAPASAPVAYFFEFYDKDHVAVTMDFLYQGESAITTDVSASSALYANQPLQVDVYGLHSQAPNYGTEADGSVTVYVECPDAATCQQAQAQLLYSALPAYPWSLSVPVVWDTYSSLAWSVVGVDDSRTNTDPNTKSTVSFVIYNLGDPSSTAAYSYTLNVYDMGGNPVGKAVTPAIPQYGTYGALLSDLFPNLPSGPFKLQVVGPGPLAWTAFEALQFHGPSATALLSTWESLPTAAATSASMNAAGRGRRLPMAARQVARPHIVQ